jgi:hypothetical protein
MPDEISYKILEAPKYALDLARSRVPPFRPGVADEFAEKISFMVRSHDIVIGPGGELLTSAGQTLPEFLESSKKAHWEQPEAEIDDAEEVWTSGNITKQGERFKKLVTQCGGNQRAAQVLFEDEAAKFGTKPGSRVPGVRPGEKRDDTKADAKSPATNPWSDNFRGTEEQRQARIASICKTSTKLANSLAAAAGVTLGGKPLRK